MNLSRHEQIIAKEERWKKLLRRWIPTYRFSNEIYEDMIRQRLGKGICWADLGCGKNELIAELSYFGSLAIGIDAQIHPHRNPSNQHDLLKADLSHLPLRAASQDLMTANDVFEHLSDPSAALREIREALRPGGCLILRTPNQLNPLTAVARLMPGKLKKHILKRIFGVASEDVFPTYYRFNRIRVIRKLLSAAGFQNFKILSIEDIHTAFGFFFFVSLLVYFMVRWRPFAFLRTNIVVSAVK